MHACRSTLEDPTIEVCPRIAHATVLRTMLPEVALGAGVVLSLLLGRLLALERVARLRASEAEHALGELASFADAVSHDFRSPVRALDAYSRLLLEDQTQLRGDAAAHLQRISANARHIGALVDGILELLRTARAEVDLTRVEVSSLAAEIVAQLQKTAPREGVDLAIEPGIGLVADASLLRQVLTHLLDNAWKFTRTVENPRIEVGTRIADGRRAVYVRDNGPGFDMAYAGDLFRPFQRMNVAPELEGIGLGLALAEKAMRRMGGRLSANAEPGKGATFTFTR